MVKTMTQDTKDRIADLERQKIDLDNKAEMMGYSGNLVKMHQIEEEIYEIEDTIRKLLPQNGSFQVVDAITIHVILNYNHLTKGVENGYS